MSSGELHETSCLMTKDRKVFPTVAPSCWNYYSSHSISLRCPSVTKTSSALKIVLSDEA